MYTGTLDDEDDDEDGPTQEKVEENDKTREKMKLLKSKMEDLTLQKKVTDLILISHCLALEKL